MSTPLTAGDQKDIHEEAQATAARLLAIVKRRPLSPPEEQRLMRAFQRMPNVVYMVAAVRGNRMANLWSDGRHCVHANLSGNAGHAPASDSCWDGGNLAVAVQAMSNLDHTATCGPVHNVHHRNYNYVILL